MYADMALNGLECMLMQRTAWSVCLGLGRWPAVYTEVAVDGLDCMLMLCADRADVVVDGLECVMWRWVACYVS